MSIFVNFRSNIYNCAKNFSLGENTLVFKILKKIAKGKNYLIFAVGFSFLIFLSGCVSRGIAAREAIIAEDKISNKQTALAIGQRTFNTSKIQLMKAIITAFSNRNLTIMNLDKELGFMVGEGGEFLDPKKVKELVQKRIERINQKAGFTAAYNYAAGNYTLRVTVNLYEKRGKKVLAKMGFNTVVMSVPNQPNYDETVAELLPSYYEVMWKEIEQSLFIQREVIE